MRAPCQAPLSWLGPLRSTHKEPGTTEIWFVEHAGRYYIVSERREESGWVKNLRKEPRVRFSIGTREAPEAALASSVGRGRVVSATEAPDLVLAVRALMDAKYKWSDGLVVELAGE